MTKWNSKMADSTREGHIKYVENRWSQLMGVENDAVVIRPIMKAQNIAKQ
jgi:hypothetical protein